MMTLYSGTTCPFSQRSRIVLYEKGMDFQIVDVDVFNLPEEIAVMNPYNRLPVLVERDLTLHESNIINEYIDERFPHPQLMPPEPVMRSRARLFLHRFEVELFSHVVTLESGAAAKGWQIKPGQPCAIIWRKSCLSSLSRSLCWVKISLCWMWPLRPFCGVWITIRFSCPSKRLPFSSMLSGFFPALLSSIP
ncbi:MAG: glutathione S-transferase N-terminal domain-containing protein [Ferrovum myxofaciens]